MPKTEVITKFINGLKAVNGVHAVSVVEISSGMTLGAFSDGNLDPEVASAYNVEVVKAKMQAIEALGLDENIDDILITLSSQYHLINCTENGQHMVYLAANKEKSNLALLRNAIRKGIDSLQNELK